MADRRRETVGRRLPDQRADVLRDIGNLDSGLESGASACTGQKLPEPWWAPGSLGYGRPGGEAFVPWVACGGEAT